MEEKIQVPYLIADAKVPITIGAGFASDLKQVLDFIVTGHTEEEMAAYKVKLQQGTTLLPWEQSFLVMSVLLKEIADVAGSKGLIEMRAIN